MTTCNITEAARLLKVHEETVAEMIRECKLPAAKVGRAWVMLERDVLDYIEQQIRRQTAERLGRTSPQVTPDCQAAVLIRKSSHKPGCMRRTFAPASCSHCCQFRALACTSAAACACVSPAASRAARTSAGDGLRAGWPALRLGWLVTMRLTSLHGQFPLRVQ